MIEVIVLGENKNPPVANLEVTQSIVEAVITEEFEVDVFNSILLALTTYADLHGVELSTGDLPWAESIGNSH